MAIGTPFHSRTAALNTSLRWKQWSGYFVANAYEDFHDPEYHAIRSGAGLIDVSPLYKYDIAGPDALRLVDRLITRNARKSQVGQVLYASWCDEAGKVLQDGTIQRLGESRFRVAAVDPALGWFELNAEGMDVQVEDVSETVGALALQGPPSREILARLASHDLGGLGFCRLASTGLGGIPVVVTRTGYTGDLGYELWVAASEAEALWDPRPALGVVMAAGGYPGRYRTGDPIEGLNGIDDPQVKVFHAGTTRPNDQVLTCGGRVLCVTALGEDLAAAHARAYAAVEKIHWADACYRHDIGHRALARVGDPGRGV